ncbi:MAG: hypothetical protein L0H93_06825 [Nocardioides sp.]|nr:hypothetical protein [Nocardioides sp.]
MRKAPLKVPQPDPAVSVRKHVPTPGAETLLQDLRRGKSFTEASVRATRSMVKAKRADTAQSLGDSLQQEAATVVAGHVASGIVAHSRGHYALALHHFDSADKDVVLEHAPVEMIDSLFTADPDRGVQETREWISGPRQLKARVWFEIYRQLFVADELSMADRAFALVKENYSTAEQAAEWRTGIDDIAWGERWSGCTRNAAAPPPKQDRISFGIVDYPQPGRARSSQNIGDQIQTLASLGHVVRQQGLRFHGDAEVVGFVEAMKERVRPELRRTDVDADVQLVTVERDSSTYQKFAPNTWLLEFGWHMHSLFGLGLYDFPLHPNLNPIFVSFHCSKRELLSPDAVDYLREHGPIGCRDWTTVDLLLSLDVPAFFSGCLTTTVNTVFPDLKTKPDSDTVYVDVVRSPVPKGKDNVKQSYGAVKKRSFVENMWDAVELLEWYRHKYTDVVTTRLHCYLPTTSLGLNVHFEPKNNADVRFAGLFRLDDKSFDAIQSRMRDRLEPVLSAIFQGQDRNSVYQLWRETVEPEVEVARQRHFDVKPLPSGSEMVHELVSQASVPQLSWDAGDGILDVVLTPTEKQLPHLAPVVLSAASAASKMLRVWVVYPSAKKEEISLPGVELHWVDTSSIDLAGSGVRDRRSLDRTLLSDLLPIDRAVLLPVDGVVVGDLADLFETDLGETRIGARSASGSQDSGFGVLYSAARALDKMPEVAFEFYTRIHRNHVFDFEAFDTDVMVLDLKGLRSDEFAASVLPAMRQYLLNDRAAFHFFAGSHYRTIGAEWAYVPTREYIDQPMVWHWSDGTKPWSADFTPGSSIWKQFTASSY